MPVHRTLRATISLAAALLIAFASAPALSAGAVKVDLPPVSESVPPLPAPAPPATPPEPSLPPLPPPPVSTPAPTPKPPPAPPTPPTPRPPSTGGVESAPGEVAKAAPRVTPPSIQASGGTAQGSPAGGANGPSRRAASAAVSPPAGRDGTAGQGGAPASRGARHSANRSVSLDPARPTPTRNWVAYVWSAVALTPNEAVISTLGMGLRLAASLAVPQLLPLLSAGSMGELAAAAAVAEIPGPGPGLGPGSEPKSRFEGSTDPALPSASQVFSAVLLLASLALLASLPLMLRRELTPPRRRPL
jgi:hypothetical protein